MQKPFFGRHLTTSLLLHVIVLTIFILSFEWRSRMPVLENSDKNEIVNALLVNTSKIQLPEPTPFAPPKNPEIPKPTKAIPQPVKKSPEPLMQNKKVIIPDTHRKFFKKEMIEKQLLMDLKKQTEKQKKAKHKSLEKAFEKELKLHAAKSLQQQLLNEKNRLESAQTKKMQGIVDKYKALILQTIADHWLVPGGVDKSLSSELLIRVAHGGAVLDVQIVRSSGDDGLDRSARSAVFKASPLPVPNATDEFELFKEFILKVKPENISVRDSDLS